MMHAQEYFKEINSNSPLDCQNDVERKQIYLCVNCAGFCDLPGSFQRVQPGGRNDYYMMYLTGGTLSVATGDSGETVVLTPGHLFIIPPHTFFRYEPIGTDPIQYLWVHFTGYGAANLLTDCSLPLRMPCNIGFPYEAEEKFHALFKAFLCRDSCMDTATVSRLMDICVLFGRSLRMKKENTSSTVLKSSNRLYVSLTYIHENLSGPLSISVLAEMENLGLTRYRTLFHEIMGISPLAYIKNLRIQQAVTLLQQTNFPIADIASSVGYEDPLYFSRVFRRTYGISPTEYRNLSHCSSAEFCRN